MSDEAGLGNRIEDERGTAATIMLFPVFATCALLLVQGVFWQQDRTTAAAAADRASAAVALYDADPGTAQVEAAGRLRSAGMTNVSVSVSRGADATVVQITATAAGLLPFTSSTISVRSTTPTEAFIAP